MNKDGFWVESGERVPVDMEGDPMELIDSSCNAEITLFDVVDETALLDRPIRLAYHLTTEKLPDTFNESLNDGAIYQFRFSYRGGPVADPALLMNDSDGDLWLLIGNASDIEFLGYQQVAICAAAVTEDDTGITQERPVCLITWH